MAADVQRWRNQEFIVSVFNLQKEGGGYVVEAINIDKPEQRAYLLSYDNFDGFRGPILKYYIDEYLKIYDDSQKSDQTGFGNYVIKEIKFN